MNLVNELALQEMCYLQTFFKKNNTVDQKCHRLLVTNVNESNNKLYLVDYKFKKVQF